MKLAKIVTPEFQRAVQVLLKQPLPIKTAHKLRGIIKKIDQELDNYEAVRKDLLGKHGKKKANGVLDIKDGVIQFEGDAMKDFIRDVNELTSIDVELPTVTLNELGNEILLSAEQLIILEGILVD